MKMKARKNMRAAAFLLAVIVSALGCATPADSYFVPVRTADQIVRDRGIVAVSFGKFGKFNSFVRKLTNDGKPLPPIDKKPREVAAEQPKPSCVSNGPEGDYGPTQYRIDVEIAGWRPEKDRELSEVRKFAEKNNLTMSVQGMNAGPRRIDCDVGVIIVEDRETLLVHQQYGWGYWKKDPLREDLLPCAGTEIHDSTGSKFPFEIIFAPLTAERLQKLWDERKPRTKTHPEGYVPRFNGTEKQASEPPKTPAKPADNRPVVTAYLMKWGTCPPCIQLEADVEQLPQSKRDALPYRFELVRMKKPSEIPPEFQKLESLTLPFLVWNIGERRWMQENWFGLEMFRETFDQSVFVTEAQAREHHPPKPLSKPAAHLPTVGRCACPNCSCVNCECRPGEPCECPNCGVPDFFGVNKKRRRAAVESRPAPAPTVQAAISSISRDYVNLLLAYFGRGEVKLTPQASLLVPENLGLKVSRKGDTVTAELSEPFPVIRYRTWGLRFDDTLRGATVSPEQAAIKLGTYGDVRFKVE